MTCFTFTEEAAIARAVSSVVSIAFFTGVMTSTCAMDFDLVKES
jgi:hypothetical protein